MSSINESIKNIVLITPTKKTMIKSQCCKKGCAKGSRV